jgi:hypothetical protein
MDSHTRFSNASNFIRPGFSISRKAVYWVIGSVLIVAALLIWAVIASAQWLLFQGKDAAVNVINGAPQITETVLGKIENVIPGAKEKLDGAIPGAKEALEGLEGAVPGATGAIEGVLGGIDLKRSTQREVSGNDVAPIARYSGLVRVAWDKAGIAHNDSKIVKHRAINH